MSSLRTTFILTVLLLPAGLYTRAQTPVERPYYSVFPKTILLRAFISDKYSVFRIRNGSQSLRYVPNTPAAIGIGLSYRDFSVNVAYGVRLVNDVNKVKTKKIDLQTHLYSRRWLYDLYAQQYKGYFLPAGTGDYITGNQYYLRPDIKTLSLGLSIYRVFNSTRFSYRAAFVQTERQKISAGTFLVGAEIYYGSMKGDSSLIPVSVKNDYTPQQLNAIRFYSLAPGGGYAYTVVIKKKFFITGSGTLNLNLNYGSRQQAPNDRWQFSLTPTVNFRAAAGYSGDRWNVSANWVAANKPFSTGNESNKYILSTGNYRLVAARRFNVGRKLQKRLILLDKLIDKLTPKK